jgi:hypothetical protein
MKPIVKVNWFESSTWFGVLGTIVFCFGLWMIYAGKAGGHPMEELALLAGAVKSFYHVVTPDA